MTTTNQTTTFINIYHVEPLARETNPRVEQAPTEAGVYVHTSHKENPFGMDSLHYAKVSEPSDLLEMFLRDFCDDESKGKVKRCNGLETFAVRNNIIGETLLSALSMQPFEVANASYIYGLSENATRNASLLKTARKMRRDLIDALMGIYTRRPERVNPEIEDDTEANYFVHVTIVHDKEAKAV